MPEKYHALILQALGEYNTADEVKEWMDAREYALYMLEEIRDFKFKRSRRE